MGFIGTAMVKRFSKKNRVTIVDRLDFGPSPELQPLIDDQIIEFVETDLADISSIHHRIKKGEFDRIVHLAALTHIPFCEQYPDFAYSSTVLSSLNILSHLNSHTRLLTFSTSSTYAPDTKKHTESGSALKPIDFYGVTKKHVEELTEYYAEKKGFSLLNIRLANAAGYGETNPKLIGTILQQIASGTDTVELGNLTPKRDYIHIDDIAWAIDRLLEEWPVNQGTVEYFNLGTGHPPVSVKELFDMIVEASGKRINLRSVENRKRKIDRELLYPDPSKLKSVITDYKPQKINEWLPAMVQNPGLRINSNLELYIKKRYGQ